MNPRTKHIVAGEPQDVSEVDVDLVEWLFDRSPDVAFFVNDALGRYVAVNQSLLARHGLQSKLTSVAFAGDGRTALTASRDGSTLLWVADQWTAAPAK